MFGDCGVDARSGASGQVTCLGDPVFASVSHVKCLAEFPRFAYDLLYELGRTSRDTMIAGSWMGIRFPGPKTIPCLVLFLDYT